LTRVAAVETWPTIESKDNNKSLAFSLEYSTFEVIFWQALAVKMR
jgi:hypothetical protein